MTQTTGHKRHKHHWMLRAGAAIMLAAPLAALPVAPAAAQEVAVDPALAEKLIGRWNGVATIQDVEVRIPSLIDIEIKQKDDGSLVAIDYTLPGGTEFPVAVDGRTFSFSPTITVGSRQVMNSQLEGTLARNNRSVEVVTRAAGLSGKIEDVRKATLTKGDRAARAFMYPRIGKNGTPVTSYTYAEPRDASGIYESATPEEAGMDRAKLEEMVNAILQETAAGKTESVLVLRDGKLVLSEYFWGNGPQDAHQTWSVVKSITATAAGIAWDRGAFNLDSTVLSYFPEYSDTRWGKENLAVSVRQVLTMASGAHIPSPFELGQSVDFNAFMFAQPLEHAPALKYNYDNGLPILTGELIERTTGQSYTSFTEDNLLTPLGIDKMRWTYLADGTPNGAGGFFITPHEFSRIGQMMLDDGMWKGKRIVSSEWVAESTRQQTAKGDYPYGFYWHLNSKDGPRFKGADAFMAIGALGQLIAVIPDEDLVVVVTSTNTEPWTLLEKYIVPAITESHAPPPEEEAAEEEPAE